MRSKRRAAPQSVGRNMRRHHVLQLIPILACLSAFYGAAAAAAAVDDVHVSVDVTNPIGSVDDRFTSVTLDFSGLRNHWNNLSFSSERVLTLMKALSPSYLRIGGSVGDQIFFDQPLSILGNLGMTPAPAVMKKQDVLDLIAFTSATDSRLIIGLDLQLRFGQQWNPSQAIELVQFLADQGLGSKVDWELGNEPDLYRTSVGQASIDGAQVGRDFIILHKLLHKLLQQYPSLVNSSIVGPDIATVTDRLAPSILTGVINAAGQFMKAVTIHHYYFKGPNATDKEYINPVHFNNLERCISATKRLVSSSQHPNLPIWIGETSDAYDSGTRGVSDRFVSGFLWLDKLGLAARQGVSVVMRQTLSGGNYALLDANMNPNPDYWLTMLHRIFVGQTVLGVTLSPSTNTTRVYAQCTNTRSNVYKPGAVTVFALNASPSLTSRLVFADDLFQSQPIDVYILSPPQPGDLLSKEVSLNGQQILKLINDHTLPKISPVHQKAGQPVQLPALTFGFFVFPFVDVAICKS